MRTLILLIPMFLFCFTSCGGGNEYSFTFNLSKGDVFKQKTVTDMDITTMGQKVAMNMGMDISYKVKEIKDDNYIIDVKYDRLTMSMPAMGLSFDSDAPDAGTGALNLAPMFKMITEAVCELTLTKSGKILSIKGFEQLLKSMEETLFTELPEEVRKQVLDQFAKQYSEESFKSMFEQASVLPDKPIKIGEKWTKDLSIQTSAPFNGTGVFTLMKVADNVATINVETQLATPENYTQEMNGIKISTQMSGTQKGVVKVNMTTGWIIEALFDMEMSGESEAMGMKIPMTIAGKIKITN